ncbi:hypothetical protein B0H14DRAFT_3484246 [Mycena olivaceomarginata]|nr:hypothetical protein B0H14DRAFT_3484246 [Mycena olivaceomarginata]
MPPRGPIPHMTSHLSQRNAIHNIPLDDALIVSFTHSRSNVCTIYSRVDDLAHVQHQASDKQHKRRFFNSAAAYGSD